jgi:hypothetical protein
VALVEEPDLALALGRSWNLSDGYARHNTHRGGRAHQVATFMHRLFLGEPAGREVDHRNRDRLDNRRCNLRAGTKAENRQNVAPRGRSRFRGVHWSTEKRRWVATTSDNGRRFWLGRFADEEAAALVAHEWLLAHKPFYVPGPEIIELLDRRAAA